MILLYDSNKKNVLIYKNNIGMFKCIFLLRTFLKLNYFKSKSFIRSLESFHVIFSLDFICGIKKPWYFEMVNIKV